MTNRIYYTDAYRTEFTAAVIDRADDGKRVYLDETAFYPTSGGQLHDLGTLGGVKVVDVVDEDDRIAHVLSAPLGATTPVRGEIDWTRRHDHMQQHTGQHLLSAVLEDLFGFKTVSVHFGAEYSTLDLDAELVTYQQLVAAEARANETVAEARPVTVTFEDARAAAGLRKDSDREGTLRIVSIEGVDRSACGGTHVRTTAEIGTVLLRSTEKIRKATRVEFVCGARAVRRARRYF
jgi:alanyl-tRNA synthetase